MARQSVAHAALRSALLFVVLFGLLTLLQGQASAATTPVK
jgi:hypothetical protein